MDVEVVGSEVQPGRGRGGEVGGVAQPEGGGLHDEQVGLGVVDGGHQRRVGVARRQGTESRPFQHVGDQRDHGCLSVGPGYGAPGAVIPACGQVGLVQDHDACVLRRGEERMPVGYAGSDDHLGRPAHQAGPVPGGRCLDQLDGEAFCTGPGHGSRPIIHAQHLHVATDQGIHHRPSGHAQAQDENPAAHRPTTPEAIESA